MYLESIACEMGTPSPIADLPDLRARPDTLENLLALGLEDYSASERSPVELAKASASRTLAESGIAPAEIDLFVFATSSLWDTGFYRKDIHRLALDLGLKQAYPVGIFLSECANLTMAVQTAAALLGKDGRRNALVVVTDAVAPGTSRIVAPGITVSSDAAASVIITSEHRSGSSAYRLAGTALHSDLGVLDLDPEKDFAAYFKGFGNGIERAARKLAEACGTAAADVRQLICNNYNLSVARVFSKQAQIESRRIFTGTLSSHAHCDAADNLINLLHYSRTTELRTGDRLWLMATGPGLWGAMELVKV